MGATCMVGLELTVFSGLSRRTCCAVFGQVGPQGPSPSSHLGVLFLTLLAALSPGRLQRPQQVSRTDWPPVLCLLCYGTGELRNEGTGLICQFSLLSWLPPLRGSQTVEGVASWPGTGILGFALLPGPMWP